MKILLSCQRLELQARAAAEDLDGFARAQGFPELELVDPPRGQPEWADAGCMWAVRRGLYSRRQREQLLQRLRKGRIPPTWEISESEGLIVCLHRNFAWRNTALGSAAGVDS